MNDKRFKLGVAITVIWLVAVPLFVFLDISLSKLMKPNEWGDFFAGFFAPLAFLWLVLGYLQQGQELQLSTKALLLQAEELKNSVEQQRELVEVTRQQVESEREALHLERVARKEATKPRFVLNANGGSFGSNENHYGVSISNAGNAASVVAIELEGTEIKKQSCLEIPIFEKSSTKTFKISLSKRLPASGALLTISYHDADGFPDSVRFKVSTIDDNRDSLDFSPIVDN